MAELLYRLGRACARRAWAVIAAWLVVLMAAGAAFLAWGGTLATSFDIPGLPSSAVVSELQTRLPDLAGASGAIVYRTDDGSPFTDEQKAQISALVADGAQLPDVAQVVDPFAAEQQRATQTAQVEAGRTQLDAGQAQLDSGQAQLDAGKAQLDAAQAQLDAGKGQPGVDQAQLAAAQAQLDAQRAQLEAQQTQLTAGRAQLDEQRAKLDAGAQLLKLSDGIRVVSTDGSAAVVHVAFSVPRLELPDASKKAAIEHFTGTPIAGVEAASSSDISQAVPAIVGPPELIGVLIAAVVLLVMLGTVVGAGIPIATALTGVAIGALGALSFSGVVQMASVTPVLGLMLGLAVGIDYSLFILNRHRRQLLHGVDLPDSIGLANGTSGTAVVFAGSTVVVALLALNVTGIPFLGLMGTVGAVCVAIAVAVAITLTPAILGLVGPRIVSRRARAGSAGQDAAVAHVKVMSTPRAVVTAIASVVVLLALAAPALGMRLGLPDGSSEPAGSQAQRASAISAEQFGAGANGPLLVAATLPAGLDEAGVSQAELIVAQALSEVHDVVAVAPIAVSADGTLAAFQVVPADGPNSQSTETLVRTLRELPPVDGKYPLGVTGQAAINIDISEALQNALPAYLAVVIGLSLIILILVFRSLLVPIVATGGFVLSLFATYGALVAVFQHGWGASLIGMSATGPILSFLPTILVGVLFGLAMDYQLFLASGMREAYVHGDPARLAVARGFRAGRAVVTAAGLIMVSVFGGFVFADSVMIRSVGFGLAFGVLVDAFVVRMLLMPALMHLLGSSAWWLPKWLDRILPNVDVEGAALERRHPHAEPAEAPVVPAAD